MDEKKSPRYKAPAPASAAKAQRLANALRENLKKRKEQARARQGEKTTD